MTNRLNIIMGHINPPNTKKTSDTNPGWDLPDDFRYTLSNNLLSDYQQRFYKENGFLVITKLVPDDILDECKTRFIDICDGKIPYGAMTLMKDISLAKTNATGEYLYNKIQNIAFDDVFEKCMSYNPLLDHVECFTGRNIMAVHSMLINKPPDAGTLSSRHPLHQDLHYFPFRPADRIVGTWIAMERVTQQNGCLFVLPGSHKQGTLHTHDYPEGIVNKAYHGVKGFDSHPKLNLEMAKGDCVFFHPLLIHGSGPNITKGFRKAISFHYAASECHYIDVRGTSQEGIANEIQDLYRKKNLHNLDYATLWKYKCRLVRGEKGNL